MKYLRQVTAVTLILIVLSGGCSYNGFGHSREQFERTVELSEPLASDSAFTAATSNGSITVTGTDEAQCRLTAIITGGAATLEEARLLAEQTEIRLDRTPEGLTAVIVRPDLKRNQYVSVRYEIQLPPKTALNLKTSNGKIGVSGITHDIHTATSNGKIEIIDSAATTLSAHTSNGGITVRQTPTQSMELHTSNGAIEAESVTGSLTASTSNGSINIRYAPDAATPADIRITTSNGGIDLTPPQNYSAKVDAATSNGKIRSSIPILVQGEMGKTLNGVIGSGQGHLYLRTSNSSISIHQP